MKNFDLNIKMSRIFEDEIPSKSIKFKNYLKYLSKYFYFEKQFDDKILKP